ncbi:MAG: hypothetical protein U0166_10815 [Acidobacteriota bacterium]
MLRLLSITLAWFAGLALDLPAIRPIWYGSRVYASTVVIAGLVVLAFGEDFGLTATGFHPELGPIKVLHPAAAIASYFLTIFAIVNWPWTLDRGGSTAPDRE